MATILIHDRGQETLLTLRTSTVIGRHWRCDAQVGHRRIPMYWIEIRWNGDRWLWRELTEHDGTRGTGAAHHGVWRVFGFEERKGRINFGERVWVRMEEMGPPQRFLESLDDGDSIVGDDVEEWLEFQDGGIFKLGSDDEDPSPLSDGDVVQLETGLFRLHYPVELSQTEMGHLDVSDPLCFLEFDPASGTATFSCRNRSATVKGVCVDVLRAFATARQTHEPQPEGWMSPQQAFEGWVAQGADASNHLKRIGWEKGKLRTQLNKQGVIGLGALFEKRWIGKTPETRLVLSPDRIDFGECA